MLSNDNSLSISKKVSLLIQLKKCILKLMPLFVLTLLWKLLKKRNSKERGICERR